MDKLVRELWVKASQYIPSSLVNTETGAEVVKPDEITRAENEAHYRYTPLLKGGDEMSYIKLGTGLVIRYEGDYDAFYCYGLTEGKEREYKLEWCFMDEWDWGRASLAHYK
jgi:hypothetical protein